MSTNRRRVGVIVPLLVAAALAAAVLLDWGEDGGAAPGFAAGVEVDGLIPPFNPAERRYVTRCGPDHPPLRVGSGPGARIRIGERVVADGAARFRPAARPEEGFDVTVTEAGRARAYSVRCLPAGFPEWRFESIRPVEDALFVVSFRSRPAAPQWVVAFDTRGVPRWWYRPERRVLWAQILSDGTVTLARAYGDGYGQHREMAHEVRDTSGRLLRLVRTEGSIIDGHELVESRPGRVMVATYLPRRADLSAVGGPRRAGIVAAGIQELDRQGRVRWSWSSRGRVAIRETRLRWWARILANPRTRLGGLRTYDPVHINAIEPNGDEVIISARHTDGIYGLRRSDGAILWKLGGRGTERSLKVVGDPAGRHLFGGQHDVRMGEDGTLSVYDNGKLRRYDARVVFYRLRPERRRAFYLGRLVDPRVVKSHCCGSARELPDGGWLVSWGRNRLLTGFDRQRRIAFRLTLAAHAYRAVPVPEGAVTLAGLDRGLERMLRRR